MKKVFKLSFVAASVLALAACNKEAPKAEVKLETEVQKQAYGLGASIGDFLKKDLEGKTEMGFELDKKLIIAGLEESLAGNSKLTEEEITNFIINFKIDIWIGFFDSFDLFYQFINKKCQG